jgi:aspartokinase
VDEIQIWTDVDGMLTADPRIVPQPASCRSCRSRKRRSWRISAPGAAPEHDPAGSGEEHPGADSQLAAAENSGTLITAEGRPAEGQLTAGVQAGRDGDRHPTTRMLMAHGFLRRLFGCSSGSRQRLTW